MRRIVGVIAIVLMIFNVSVYASEMSEWAREDLEGVFESGLVSDVYFEDYQRSITRGEYGYLIYQLYEHLSGQPISSAIDLSSTYGFTDTDDLYLTALKGAGLAKGYTDGSYKPEANISREEIMTFYVRLLEVLGYELELAPMTFTDQGDISRWAIDSVAKCTTMAIVKGKGDNKVDPKGQASVQESLVVFNRIMTNTAFEASQVDQFLAGAYIVSDLKTTYAVGNDLLGMAVGIDAYRDYDYIGRHQTGDNIGSWLAMDQGILYYVDGDGLLKSDSQTLLVGNISLQPNQQWYVSDGRLFIQLDEGYSIVDIATGMLVLDQDLVTPDVNSVSMVDNTLLSDGEIIFSDVKSYGVIGNHVIVLLNNGQINGYDTSDRNHYAIGNSDAEMVYVSGNYLVLKSQIHNEISHIRYVPVFDMRDYLN